MFCCLCVSGGSVAMFAQLSTCSLPMLTSNGGKQYLLMWLLIILGCGEGDRKREREKRNTAAFDASESLDLLSASLGRVISPLIIKVELLWNGGREQGGERTGSGMWGGWSGTG